MATVEGPKRIDPHEEQMQRAELVERYCRQGLQVTEAVIRVASELNIQPRTVHRARNYRDAFLKLPQAVKEALRDLVNRKKIKVGFVYRELPEVGEEKQLEMLEAWRRGEFPETATITRDDESIPVSVPVDEKRFDADEDVASVRESYKIQSALAYCGEQMRFQIWVPKRDRGNILREWSPQEGNLLNELPLNFSVTVLRTIQEIDVLWIRRQSIIRAFEVEHSTSIYSGLLRMADLISLIPNIDVKLHIVAPADRKKRVFEQMTRPVFNYLEKSPLSKVCSFLPYDAIREIQRSNLLPHAQDSVIDDFAEYASEEED